jgi:hypothetical protein
MWGCVLTPASGCFSLNHNSQTNISQAKADYIIISTIFHYIWVFVEYQYTVSYNTITQARGNGFYERGKI